MSPLFLCLSFLCSREWYMNGNYLVIIVSLLVILPLALMKQLGKYVDAVRLVRLHSALLKR